MSDDHIELDGEVVESIRGVITVAIPINEENIFGSDEEEMMLKCHVGGKMRQHKINVVVGDFVKVKISPYDLTRGIVVLRYKKGWNNVG